MQVLADDDPDPVTTMQIDTLAASAADLQQGLRLLYAERSLAELVGLSTDLDYMTNLLDDIAVHESAFIGAAVESEISTLRAELEGPPAGVVAPGHAGSPSRPPTRDRGGGRATEVGEVRKPHKRGSTPMEHSRSSRPRQTSPCLQSDLRLLRG